MNYGNTLDARQISSLRQKNCSGNWWFCLFLRSVSHTESCWARRCVRGNKNKLEHKSGNKIASINSNIFYFQRKNLCTKLFKAFDVCCRENLKQKFQCKFLQVNFIFSLRSPECSKLESQVDARSTLSIPKRFMSTNSCIRIPTLNLLSTKISILSHMLQHCWNINWTMLRKLLIAIHLACSTLTF